MGKCKVVAISNQKGGVAKTTSTGAIAAGLAIRGYKVLAIDLDPQGNLSESIGADNQSRPTIYDILKSKAQVRETVQKMEAFDLIPANILLAQADLEFTATGKEKRLKESIEPILGDYDYLILDTPPSLGIMTINAFTAADEVIIPTTPSIFAASGIMQLFSTIATVRKYCNPALRIAGILMTKCDPRTTISKDIRELTEELSNAIDTQVFKTFIRCSVSVEKAQAERKDLFTYDKKMENNVTKDYDIFVEEYLKEEK